MLLGLFLLSASQLLKMLEIPEGSFQSSSYKMPSPYILLALILTTREIFLIEWCLESHPPCT